MVDPGPGGGGFYMAILRMEKFLGTLPGLQKQV